MTFERLGPRSRPSISLGGLERAVELLDYRLAPEASESFGITDPFADSDWCLRGSAYQSLDTGSLYRYARDHSGQTVPFVVRPKGNAIPTANAPHYTGEAVVGPKPELGGSASDRAFLFEFSWAVIDEPQEVTS